MHLTDEQLNEYLDNESTDHTQVETHLSACADCAARLNALQALFDEIESLPEAALSHDLAAPLTRRVSGRVSLPRVLRLTAILQFVTAVVALLFAAPFVTRSLLPYLSAVQTPSMVSWVLQVQTQWITWFDLLSQFQLPGIPEVPVFDLPGLFIVPVIVGVSVLWLVGNGLLLRNQVSHSR